MRSRDRRCVLNVIVGTENIVASQDSARCAVLIYRARVSADRPAFISSEGISAKEGATLLHPVGQRSREY